MLLGGIPKTKMIMFKMVELIIILVMLIVGNFHQDKIFGKIILHAVLT